VLYRGDFCPVAFIVTDLHVACLSCAFRVYLLCSSWYDVRLVVESTLRSVGLDLSRHCKDLVSQLIPFLVATSEEQRSCAVRIVRIIVATCSEHSSVSESLDLLLSQIETKSKQSAPEVRQSLLSAVGHFAKSSMSLQHKSTLAETAIVKLISIARVVRFALPWSIVSVLTKVFSDQERLIVSLITIPPEFSTTRDSGCDGSCLRISPRFSLPICSSSFDCISSHHQFE
jgi:hypothetical protein